MVTIGLSGSRGSVITKFFWILSSVVARSMPWRFLASHPLASSSSASTATGGAGLLQQTEPEANSRFPMKRLAANSIEHSPPTSTPMSTSQQHSATCHPPLSPMLTRKATWTPSCVSCCWECGAPSFPPQTLAPLPPPQILEVTPESRGPLRLPPPPARRIAFLPPPFAGLAEHTVGEPEGVRWNAPSL